MSYLVMKFGGSSLQDAQRMEHAARRALTALRSGSRVVMVVSAQGKTTDSLAAQAAALGHEDARERDALLCTGEQISAALAAMYIGKLGGKAQSLSGWQAGIRAEGPFGDGNVTAVDTGLLRQLCGDGIIPVVTGFQGITAAGELITLGRGGSDTTAVELARALGAGICRIYTDVCGVYSADPAKVPGAIRHKLLDYDVMDKLARAGAKVLHGKAAVVAREYGVPLQICSSLVPGDQGTYIRRDAPRLPVAGVTCHALPEDGGLHRLTVVGRDADTPSFLVRLERGLAEAGICGMPLGGDDLCRWALIPAEKADAALRAVHREFF